MIQFATPWGLLALLSVPLILLLHVLRPRRRTVQVASTRLWSEALDERRRGLGLRRLMRSLSLLLLLLTASAVSLGLAGARWVTPAKESTDTVMVLDTSASMTARQGGTTRFELAREQAARLIDQMPDGSRMLIMTSARHAVLQSGFENDRDTLRRVLAGIQPTEAAGRPGRAVDLALSLLSGRDRARVDFITDGAFDPGVVRTAPQLRYHLVGGPTRNVAITRFDFRPEPGGERFQVLVGLKSYQDRDLAVPLRITLEQRTLLARDVALPAMAQRTLVLPFDGKALGRATARIEADDDLSADDAAFAVVNVAEPLRVRVIGPENFFLRSVLEAAPEVEATFSETTDARQLEDAARIHDVVIVDRVPLPGLPAGNFLLLDTVPEGLPVEQAGVVERPAITGQAPGAMLQDVDLTGIRIDAARRVSLRERGPGVQRLFWSDDTELGLALLTPVNRVVYLGFELARSDLPLRTAFPVFMNRALQWLRGEAGNTQGPRARTWFPAGDTVTIRGSAAHGDLIMRSPSGEGSTHELDGGVLLFDATARTGVYRYSIGGVARHFAVNLTDAAESDLSARAGVQQSPPAESEPGPAVRSVPLWPHLALVALMLLVLEWGVWSTGRRHA